MQKEVIVMDGFLVYWTDENEENHFERVYFNKNDALEYADSEQKKKNNQGREVDFYVTRIDVIK